MHTLTDFETWNREFEALARTRDLEWLLSCSPQTRRRAFEAGTLPDEEIDALAEMSAWRGCGCGGT